MPRERFNTTVRERIEAMLREVFHGESLDSNVLMGESVLARLHVTVRPHPGDQPKFNVQELETRVLHIVRNWHDGLRDSLVGQAGAAQGVALFNRFDKLLPAGYIEDVAPEQAALVGQQSKPESYFFPPQMNNYAGDFPFTFFGLEPGTTPDQVRHCLEIWDRGDNHITDLSRAYRLTLNTLRIASRSC